MAELKGHGFEISMAQADNPYENAMMESFFKTLKYEEVYLCEENRFSHYGDIFHHLTGAGLIGIKLFLAPHLC